MLVRVLEGTLALKQKIQLWSNKKKFEVQELGVFAPFSRPVRGSSPARWACWSPT